MIRDLVEVIKNNKLLFPFLLPTIHINPGAFALSLVIQDHHDHICIVQKSEEEKNARKELILHNNKQCASAAHGLDEIIAKLSIFHTARDFYLFIHFFLLLTCLITISKNTFPLIPQLLLVFFG